MINGRIGIVNAAAAAAAATTTATVVSAVADDVCTIMVSSLASLIGTSRKSGCMSIMNSGWSARGTPRKCEVLNAYSKHQEQR
jgi:hypothetical protein